MMINERMIAMKKKPGIHDELARRASAYSAGAGSKQSYGGKTSKPAARSRSMRSPAFQAKRDIKAGRSSAHTKSR